MKQSASSLVCFHCSSTSSVTAPGVEPKVWGYNGPRMPTIPTKDFSNVPKRQRGLHQRGFEYLRI